MSDADSRLDAAVEQRNALEVDVRRLEGKLEAAEAALAAVEKECRDRNIDPDRIDEVITQLETRYESLVAQLEMEVAEASAALAPYMKETP